MSGARPKHLRVRPRAIGRPSPFSCRRSQDGAGSCGIRSGDGPGGHDHWVIAAGKDRGQHSDLVRKRRRRRPQRDAALAPRRFRRLTDLSAEGCWKQPRTVGLPRMRSWRCAQTQRSASSRSIARLAQASVAFVRRIFGRCSSLPRRVRQARRPRPQTTRARDV